MIKEKITIANLKCGGCETTITNAIERLKGVTAVKVYPESDQVEVTFESVEIRQDIVHKLASLGYPEATAENGLLMQLKSYASCAVGKISNKKASLTN